jgi:protein SCO1/2
LAASAGPVPDVETGSTKLPSTFETVRFDQHFGAMVPLDTVFTDESGAQVHLRDLSHGKPIILVLAYYGCKQLCTEVLNDLVKGLRGVPYNAGRDFDVVVISFDAREDAKPGFAAAKKDAYVEAYSRPGCEGGWHFLTGKQSSIDAVADAVGFRAVYDPREDQFAHASGVVVLTPEGKVGRYLFGLGYDARDIRLALIDSSEGKVGTPFERVLLYCFHYNPSTGRYTAAVVNAVRVGAVLTMVGLVGFWLASSRRGRRPKNPAVAG